VSESVPNIVARQLHAENANEVWTTDVTEFKVGGEKLYLSSILDLYNGEIVAYQIDRRPRFEMVSKMLKTAVGKLAEHEAPVLHSDQGWQYQMPAYRRQLAARGLTPSMSRRGNCLDNAAMESFFGTLKTELFYMERFESLDLLEKAIHGYIHDYNHERIKLKLKGLSPVQYRTQALAA
jgi:transposase InsO family protein